MKKNITKASKKVAKKPISKPASINHLSPIHDMISCIRTCQIKLNGLFETTSTKLEKLIAAAKYKLTKLSEQHTKAALSLNTAKEKHQAKPSKMTQVAVKNAEKAQADILKGIELMKREQATLEAQLATCKEMQTSILTDKPRAEKPAAKKAATAKTKKANVAKTTKKSPDETEARTATNDEPTER